MEATKNNRICACCQWWNGAREFDTINKRVILESDESGLCTKPSKMYDRPGNSGACGDFELCTMLD